MRRLLILLAVLLLLSAGCSAVYTEGLYHIDTYDGSDMMNDGYPMADSLHYFRDVVNGITTEDNKHIQK